MSTLARREVTASKELRRPPLRRLSGNARRLAIPRRLRAALRPLTDGGNITGERKPAHIWTPAEVDHVIELLILNPRMTAKEIAERVNARSSFLDGKPEVDEAGVEAALKKHVYPRHPELKKKPQGPSYAWTPKKVRFLEATIEEDPGITNKGLADGLNNKFPGEVRATEKLVRSRLANEVYVRKPVLRELRRQSRSH